MPGFFYYLLFNFKLPASTAVSKALAEPEISGDSHTPLS
jgi:hypothetical protein